MAAISPDVLTAVSWAFVGVAIALTGVRLWVRGKILRQFSWDDAAHLLALLLLVSQVSVIFTTTSMMRRHGKYDSDEADQEDVELFLRLNLAAVLLTWFCLYAIKAAFLLLYHRIFQVSAMFIRAWWVVLMVAILTFWALIAGTLTQCGTPSRLSSAEHCESAPILRRAQTFVIYGCILNVLSDLAIMALPLGMLKKLQMRTTAKIGLAGVFCCAMITIAFDIIRTVETITRDGTAGSTALWTNLESAIAVIVSSLPSLAALTHHRHKQNPRRAPDVYQPRSLIVSGSAKSCLSGGSSLHTEAYSHYSVHMFTMKSNPAEDIPTYDRASEVSACEKSSIV